MRDNKILAPKLKRRLFLELVSKRIRPGSGSSLNFLNTRSWTNPVSNLNTIIPQGRFVIVGGVATRLYMPERSTVDVNIAIAASDAAQVYQELERSGGIQIGRLNIPGTEWKLSDGTSLDVLEISEEWINQALAKPNYSPDGLPVIDLPYLILMKLLASRTQDLADISRMLGGATEELIQEIRKVVSKYLSEASDDLESLIVLGQLEYQS